MEITERTIIERSGILELIPGCPNGFYLVYVEKGEQKTLRLMDGPPGIGVSVDIPFNTVPRLITALNSLYE